MERIDILRYIHSPSAGATPLPFKNAERKPDRIQRLLLRRNNSPRLSLRRWCSRSPFLQGVFLRRCPSNHQSAQPPRSPRVSPRHQPSRRHGLHDRTPRRLQRPTQRASAPHPRITGQESRRPTSLLRRRHQQRRRHPRQRLSRTHRRIDNRRLIIHALHQPHRNHRHERHKENIQEPPPRREKASPWEKRQRLRRRIPGQQRRQTS